MPLDYGSITDYIIKIRTDFHAGTEEGLNLSILKKEALFIYPNPQRLFQKSSMSKTGADTVPGQFNLKDFR